MLVRSSPEGYSDVTEGNIFLLLPATACSIRFITWPASYLDDLLIYFRVTFYLSLRFMFNIRCFAVDDLLIYISVSYYPIPFHLMTSLNSVY